MARGNGKTQIDPKEIDAEHELPPSDNDGEGPESAQGKGSESAQAAEPAASAQSDSELQRLKAERDALLDRLARLQAEFDNARKRAAKEQQEYREYAIADAVKTLLPVLDSFERALQTGDGQKTEFRSGIELIYKQLQDGLAKLGLRRIPAQGEEFDPHLHEAIQMVDTKEARDHEVLEELQRGYKLKDRLLRPAMVKVARNPGR
jgi:molecular chaperone GrpE